MDIPATAQTLATDVRGSSVTVFGPSLDAALSIRVGTEYGCVDWYPYGADGPEETDREQTDREQADRLGSRWALS
jgi:hypothetical protein